MTGLSKLFLSKLSRCQWSHLVEVVLLLEAHAHLLEVLPVGEHDALGITDFIQKHFHAFGLNNDIMVRFCSCEALIIWEGDNSFEMHYTER